jgi:hypothetical protein
MGRSRGSPGFKAGPVAAAPAQSQRLLQLGRTVVLVVVLLAVAAGLLPLVVLALCSSAMPAASPPR